MGIEVRQDFDAKNLTSFKVSGLIKNAYFPKSLQEFETLLSELANPIVLGNCSNVLISSYGYDGDIIFTKKCNNIKIEANKIYAECGVQGPFLAKFAQEKGLSGLEFLIGFPGSIGGEVYMNASAKEQSISDCLVSAVVFDMDLKCVKTLSKTDLKFSYRHSVCQEKRYVVLSAEFELKRENSSLIKDRMDYNLDFRKNHQPSLVLPNCGSVFKNPENDSAGRLLESVGAKELSVGGAKVWENHANFIINKNCATSEDILNLMLLLYNKVKSVHSIKLDPEVVYVGNKSKNEAKIWKILQEK